MLKLPSNFYWSTLTLLGLLICLNPPIWANSSIGDFDQTEYSEVILRVGDIEISKYIALREYSKITRARGVRSSRVIGEFESAAWIEELVERLLFANEAKALGYLQDERLLQSVRSLSEYMLVSHPSCDFMLSFEEAGFPQKNPNRRGYDEWANKIWDESEVTIFDDSFDKLYNALSSYPVKTREYRRSDFVELLENPLFFCNELDVVSIESFIGYLNHSPLRRSYAEKEAIRSAIRSMVVHRAALAKARELGFHRNWRYVQEKEFFEDSNLSELFVYDRISGRIEVSEKKIIERYKAKPVFGHEIVDLYVFSVRSRVSAMELFAKLQQDISKNGVPDRAQFPLEVEVIEGLSEGIDFSLLKELKTAPIGHVVYPIESNGSYQIYLKKGGHGSALLSLEEMKAELTTELKNELERERIVSLANELRGKYEVVNAIDIDELVSYKFNLFER